MSLNAPRRARYLSILMWCLSAASLMGCPATDDPIPPQLDMDLPPSAEMGPAEMGGEPDGGDPVEAPEITSLSAQPASGKAPLTVSFTAGVRGGAPPYQSSWDFGDESPAARGLEGIEHTYLMGGQYVARLTVTDQNGASSSSSVTVEVEAPDAPVINEVQATPDSGIAPLTVAFQATVSGANGPLNYEWDFKDGNTSDRSSPSHVFQQSGTFPVELVVTDSVTGARSQAKTVEVKVASDDAPVAAASATPQQGIAPLTVSLRGSVVGGNEPYTFEWEFGDESQGAEAQNPSHLYETPGTYTALFTVTDADGDSDTASVEIQAQSNAIPQIDIRATPPVGLAPLSVQFGPQAQGGDVPLAYEWDFGDGTTSTQASPSHVYQDPDTYTVSLKVTDANGDEATDSAQVVVNSDEVPTASAQATPTSGLAPLQVQFSAQGMGGNAPLSYQWSFGDGSQDTGRNVSYTYQNSGQYQATITVTDDNGDVATDTVTIDVGSNLVPTANASATPRQGFAPLGVDFFANASGGNGAYTYSWTFGDGSPPSSDQNPSHSYGTSGTYTVTLVVSDADGDSSSDTLEIEVFDNAVPAIAAQASPDTGIVPFNVNFQASVSQGDAPFGFNWDFGDGSQPSTLQNPSHSYTTGGSYTATVTVTDANGDTASDTVAITAADNTQPIVTASSDLDTGTRPLVVQFTASGQGGNAPLSYTWFFGDGSAPADGAATQHTYQNAGIYQATVIVEDADGDTSQDEVTINVLDQAPDLQVESYTATPVGRDIQFEVMIRNGGVEDSTNNFVVRFYEDLAQAPGAATSSTSSSLITTPIAAGATETVSVTLTDRPIGIYDTWVFVDPLRQNPDLDRSNNIAGPEQVTISGLLINEVYYDSPGSDAGTYVELFGLGGLDVSGYVLEEINGSNGSASSFTLPAGTQIPPDGYLVIGDGGTTNQDVDAGGWADLQNGPDSLVLKDPQGNIVDALGWGDFGGMNFAGEGGAAADVGEGYTLGRDGESRDTDDNAVDFYVWATPTPGELNAHPLVNAADSCPDAYTLADDQAGRFVIEGDLGASGVGNDYTTLGSGSISCIVSADPLGGADQVFAFTIPAGSTGTVSLDLSETADIDIDSALTGAPCSDIDAGFIGCNYGTSNSYDMLAPGTYYLVIFEDSSMQETGPSEPYRYEIELTLQ